MHSSLLHLIYLIIAQISLIIYGFSLKGIPVGQEDIQSEAYCQSPCRCPCGSLGCEDCCHYTCDHLISVAFAVIHTNSRTYKCLEHQSDRGSYSEDRAEEAYYHSDKIWEKISVSRNKIKKLICFSLLLIFVREADQDQEAYTSNNSQRIFVQE